MWGKKRNFTKKVLQKARNFAKKIGKLIKKCKFEKKYWKFVIKTEENRLKIFEKKKQENLLKNERELINKNNNNKGKS